MRAIKQTLFTGWHFMRWIRLAFGIFFAIQAIQTHDTLVGVVAGFFLFTSVTNTGCCGAGSCAAPLRKDSKADREGVTIEEVRN